MERFNSLTGIVLVALFCTSSSSHSAEPTKDPLFVTIEEVGRIKTTPDDVRGIDMSDVQGLSFSPDGKRLAAICERREVQIYDVEKRNRIITIKVAEGDFFDVLFGPQGKTLVTMSHEHFAHRSTVQVWSVAGGEQLWDHEFSNRTTAKLSDNPEELVFVRHEREPEKTIASSFKLATGDPTSVWKRVQLDKVELISHEHGGKVHTGKDEETFHVVDTVSGKVLWESTGVFPWAHFHISPSGTLVVCQAKQLALYEVMSGKHVKTITSYAGTWFLRHREDHLNPQGWLIALFKSDQELCFHDAHTGNHIKTFPVDDVSNFTRCPIAWSPDGRYFADATSRDGSIRLLEIKRSWMPSVRVGN